MASNPVGRLNADLKHLTNATNTQHKAEHGYNVDTASEKTALAQIAQQKQALIDAFEAAPSTDTATQTKLMNEIYALGMKDVQTQDAYKQKLAADKHQIGVDAGAVHHWKQQALKDLLPAEYKLNLAQTNADRKELGLGAVKKPIRPPPAKHTTHTYVVQSGDTMSGIASRFGISLAQLEHLNPQVRNPNVIDIGERLTVPGGRGPGSVGPVVGGTVGQWISQAQHILAANGVPYSLMNAADINIIIQHESSGNPNAENKWDINWQEGHPSIGLMQTIQPTFDAHSLPGHGNIWNPIDNIIAGVRYAIARYGSISNVPGVVDVHAGRGYVGY